jgi:hypothetical protein
MTEDQAVQIIDRISGFIEITLADNCEWVVIFKEPGEPDIEQPIKSIVIADDKMESPNVVKLLLTAVDRLRKRAEPTGNL